MATFTTNWALYGTMHSKNKQKKIDEPEIHSKEIQKKIQLIKKVFH